MYGTADPQRRRTNKVVLILVPTKRFYVWQNTPCRHGDRKEGNTARLLKEIAVTASMTSAVANLKERGVTEVTLPKGELTEAAAASLAPLIRLLQLRYDAQQDCFDISDEERERLGLVRHPRIGRGKHNIHFDAYSSTQHAALEHMVLMAGVGDLLSSSHDESCCGDDSSNESPSPKSVSSLREIGLSMTCPSREGTHGDGMELHSDGPRGENTVLMSFDDISNETGALLVVPGSHLRYRDGEGHGDIDKSQPCDAICYKALTPVCIDARLLHGVTSNTTKSWRVIVWFIFDNDNHT